MQVILKKNVHNTANDTIIGTNKCQYVINPVGAEPVRLKRMLEVLLIFLKVGHTKTKADKLFANNALSLLGRDYFNHL